jgi:RNA polymerase sigma factor (sigma-70 family)
VEASPRQPPSDHGFPAASLLALQPDAVLCRLAARGRSGAYEALYERYRAPLVAFTFHLLGRSGSAEDAEDIAQDAFTRAFAGIREKQVDGSFKAWLYTIARNRTIDVMRSRRERVASLDSDSVEPPTAPASDGPDQRAEQRAELDWLVAAVGELPERQRDALLLKELAGLSHRRIADELETTVSATKKLISRGRDGIEVAASSAGYARGSNRLGRDLALSAPVLPVSVSLAALGVTAGAGGSVLVGKVAATTLAVVFAGGGVVAVEQRVERSVGASTAAIAAAPAKKKSPPSSAKEPVQLSSSAVKAKDRGGDDDKAKTKKRETQKRETDKRRASDDAPREHRGRDRERSGPRDRERVEKPERRSRSKDDAQEVELESRRGPREDRTGDSDRSGPDRGDDHSEDD